MSKYILLGFATLALLGASCSPETVKFDNSSKETSQETSMEKELPKSDKVGQVITATPPDNLLNERVETGSSSKEGPQVLVKTTLGDIKIQLFEKATPKTVENFLSLVKQDFYDGTIFHRIIPNFMLQGGDPKTREQRDQRTVHGTGGPGYQFADEISNHKNVRGALSMANSGPNTNGSQFFLITTEATPWLDGIHAVFGEVIEGLDVVDKIEKVSTDSRDHPIDDIEIIDIEILS